MRELNWGSSRNIRDLGGLPTPQSPTGYTMTGRVARGPRRELLAKDGWDAAAKWGLRTVVDLRCADEVGPRAGDPNVAPPCEISVVHAPTEDQSHPEFRAICMPILDSPEYWTHNIRILPKLISGALEAVAHAQPGVLVHCAAGRDRTGMITALLLAHAGVDANHIFADYAMSVWAMAGTAAHNKVNLDGGWVDPQSRWAATDVQAWLSDVEPHVRLFVANSPAVFDRLRLSTDIRRRLRSLLIPAGNRKPTYPDAATTIQVMTTISLADAKAKLSGVLDVVRDTHERVVVTRNGRPEVVIMSVSDLEALEETLDLLATPGALQEIHEAEKDIAAGRFISGDELRSLVAERRRIETADE